MKNTVLTLLFFSLSVSVFAQSDEINISASFAQSIELRVVGSNSINYSFTTISHYTNGRWLRNRRSVSFEVASSTNFEVQIAFSPFTSAEGNIIELYNVTYYLGVDRADYGGRGTRWEFGPQDVVRYDGSQLSQDLNIYGEFVGSTSPKTLIVPAGEGNAGDFEDNKFYIVPHVGFWWMLDQMGKPRLLDQNISPGTYTTILTLTAIPSIL